MTKTIHYFVFMIFVFGFHQTSVAQESTAKNYTCLFRDTVTVKLPDSIFQQLSLKATEDQNEMLPDSIKKELASQLKMNFVLSSPMQIQDRKVVASPDSTIISFVGVENKGLNTNLPYKKMILLNGRTVKAVLNHSNETTAARFKQRKFVASGDSTVILGFTCEKYLSQEDNVQIWITKELPSVINPGVAGVDVPGAILRFVIPSQQQIVSSTLVEIK